ncbi:eukaryotic translation initiation factor 4 gamma 2, partial [Drosophila subpulchrella]|uniref:eukaryotic translation initiation factor 4 gamma 2 n=1 Tax=Drosophila subpulchrella TaxID=1486046 RepID=UPI0018A14BD7
PDPDPQKTGKPTKTPRGAHSVPPTHEPISPPSRSRKASTIPLSTYDAAPLLHSYDDSPQRWSGVTNGHQAGVIIDQFRGGKAITIEGGTSTGDTTSIGGGSDLRLVITANPSEIERNYEQPTNRGGGGGGGVIGVSCGGQTPPTPTVGKTLLNTSPNLLPITTATDTFNNLKNLVKIDKGSSPSSGSNTQGGGSYRKGGSNGSGFKGAGGNGGSPAISGNSEGGRNGSRSSGGPTGHFSTGYSKNSAKIRQHDSEVSPRPRRSYQGDSSSSRYYSKNSDILGQGLTGSSDSYNGGGSSGRYQQQDQQGGAHRGSRNNYHSNSDGSYNRSINSNSQGGGGGSGAVGSGSGGSNYRSARNYENGNGSNGPQPRYGSGNGNGNSSNSSSGYNGSSASSTNNSKSSYGASRGGNDGGVSGGYSSNYRDSYEDSPSHQRYNNTNSLERNGGGGSGAGASGGPRSYGRSEADRYGSAPASRTPTLRNGNASAQNSGSTSNSSNISLNSGSAAAAGGAAPHSQQQQQQDRQERSQAGKAITPPPITGRWIPPSLRPQHGLTQSEKNDAVFRRVRGILNKLTPEKFQELSDELLKLDLNSIVILNGVILLIFDKALDEPKYSSMYAQLCKRLSEEAPSFDKEPNNSCTFLRLLIAVCRDKFNNRLKRDENDNRPPPENEADEEERRHLAKQRMLGNVKFIGELNKLDMLSKTVLHQCIMELLDKKKKRTAGAQEMCEDMECLAQLLKTCGKNLDSEQGKELMNQYFETLERRSKSSEYPPRIRFMLKDVIELRQNHWVPRKLGTTEGPVPIKQIRSDDDSIIRTPFPNRNRDMRNNDRDSDSWMNRFHLNIQPGGYNDMFSGLSVTGASPIVSPFATSNRDRDRDNRQYNNRGDRNRDRDQGGSGGANYGNRYNKHNQNGGGSGGGGSSNNRDRDDSRRNNDRDRDRNDGQYGGNQLLGSKELAPRFKRNLITTNQDAVENLQMRPAANSLLFRAASQNQKFPATLPMSTPPNNSGNNNQGSSQGKDQGQLSNSHYPMLGTPTSHLLNPARPSSTPSAEYAESRNLLGAQHERGLKATTSSPNFGSGAEKLGEQIEGQAARKGSHDGKDQAKNGGSGERPSTPVGGNGSAKQQKKDKGPNKEELSKKAGQYFKDNFYYEEEDADDEVKDDIEVKAAETETPAAEDSEAKEDGATPVPTPDRFTALVDGFLELKLPEKSLKDVCLNLLMDVLDRVNDVYLERVVRLLQTLRKQSNIKSNIVVEVFKQLVNKMNEREALNPRIASLVASVLAKTVCEPALLKLSDIANFTDNGQHYPLFLLVLQQLVKVIGKDALEEKFRASKVDLINSLPESDRNKERLAEILEDRQLSFLYPLLKVQAEMLKQLQSDPNPNNFYKWVKANVDNKYYKDPGFIQALMTVVVKYVTKETTLAANIDPKEHPEKSVTQKEQQLLENYSQMLQTFLGQNELQLMALYALQTFCYNENFPKGMLCRWFKYLYESEIIEEEAFVLWKEEISDKYPGKGSALFQVNAWLTWLQEAESEDDED